MNKFSLTIEQELIIGNCSSTISIVLPQMKGIGGGLWPQSTRMVDHADYRDISIENEAKDDQETGLDLIKTRDINVWQSATYCHQDGIR